VRPLSSLETRALDGTEGATRPFWSPDSRFIGFFAAGKLKKVEASGGPPQKICDYPSGSDGTWSPAGVILFDGRATDPILRVSAEGGTPVIQVNADVSRKETQVAWPEFLPDGRHFLYMAQGQKPEDHMYRIGSLDSKESRALAPAQSLVTYAPPGHLLFVRENTLVAQPFDAKAMKTTGEPVPLAEHIGTISTGLAKFSVSRNGVLAYRTGENSSRLAWFNREGKELSAIGDPGDYSDTMLSPGGDRLAFVLSDPRNSRDDIWIRDLARGVSSRFTFDPGDDFSPLWSPDGKTIVFSEPRRRQFQPLHEARRGRRPGTAPPSERRDEAGLRLVPRRALHHLSEPGTEDRLGPLAPADFRRQETDPLPADPLQRNASHHLSQRALAGVPVQRVGAG
jgi:hypothetical protein